MPFSSKQMQVLSWWVDGSPVSCCDAIIADGSVRTGKSLCLSMSFILWAMSSFKGQQFAMAGKTIAALERNVIRPLQPIVEQHLGMKFHYSRAKGYISIQDGDNKQIIYAFSGKDEGSASLIQGVTLAGILLDEVALMPRSFVEQALARCSVDGSKFWFCCNPDGGPQHWFYREWIAKKARKRAFYVHFTMDDNPSLSEDVKRRYKSLYTGIFKSRMIDGLWVAAHGLVYPSFSRDKHVYRWSEDKGPNKECLQEYSRSATLSMPGYWVVSCDYGTYNPAAFGLWFYSESDGIAYLVREFYHDGRETGIQYDDSQYYDLLVKFIDRIPVRYIIIDPSASSFITYIYNRNRYHVLKAVNDVLDGIRDTATALGKGWIKIHESCANTIREFGEYSWDDKASGEDRPLKESDHCMDGCIRYFVETILVTEKQYEI